jgi:hypothetical protein
MGWILISSRLYPQIKVEITINLGESNLNIKTRLRRLRQAELAILKELGIIYSEYKDEINIIIVPVNSKIVTDIIYFCLEKIGGQGKARNIKISTPGGIKT